MRFQAKVTRYVAGFSGRLDLEYCAAAAEITVKREERKADGEERQRGRPSRVSKILILRKSLDKKASQNTIKYIGAFALDEKKNLEQYYKKHKEKIY